MMGFLDRLLESRSKVGTEEISKLIHCPLCTSTRAELKQLRTLFRSESVYVCQNCETEFEIGSLSPKTIAKFGFSSYHARHVRGPYVLLFSTIKFLSAGLIGLQLGAVLKLMSLAIVGPILIGYFGCHWLLSRSEAVCSRGPYRYVRHPMYLFRIVFAFTGLLVIPSVPLVVGLATVLAASLLIFVSVIEIPLEDSIMMSEYPNEYAQYKARVKYNLIPLLW